MKLLVVSHEPVDANLRLEDAEAQFGVPVTHAEISR